ncbi:MAG: hypothetical protein ABI324_27040, partial [Ktedonobacteraceae bacterium]
LLQRRPSLPSPLVCRCAIHCAGRNKGQRHDPHGIVALACSIAHPCNPRVTDSSPGWRWW